MRGEIQNAKVVLSPRERRARVDAVRDSLLPCEARVLWRYLNGQSYDEMSVGLRVRRASITAYMSVIRAKYRKQKLVLPMRRRCGKRKTDWAVNLGRPTKGNGKGVAA